MYSVCASATDEVGDDYDVGDIMTIVMMMVMLMMVMTVMMMMMMMLMLMMIMGSARVRHLSLAASLCCPKCRLLREVYILVCKRARSMLHFEVVFLLEPN